MIRNINMLYLDNLKYFFTADNIRYTNYETKRISCHVKYLHTIFHVNPNSSLH